MIESIVERKKMYAFIDKLYLFLAIASLSPLFLLVIFLILYGKPEFQHFVKFLYLFPAIFCLWIVFYFYKKYNNINSEEGNLILYEKVYTTNEIKLIKANTIANEVFIFKDVYQNSLFSVELNPKLAIHEINNVEFARSVLTRIENSCIDDLLIKSIESCLDLNENNLSSLRTRTKLVHIFNSRLLACSNHQLFNYKAAYYLLTSKEIVLINKYFL